MLQKYSDEDYIYSGFWPETEEIECHVSKVVTCRKDQFCGFCAETISKGSRTVRETGFFDKKPVSTYTCLGCIDKWLDGGH